MRWLLSLIITVNCFGYYRSDINRDGITNLLDFQYLASEWLLESEEYVSNNYLTFNGSTQYVTVPDNNALDVDGNAFSATCWVKISSLVTDSITYIISKTSTPMGSGYGIYVDEATGDIQFNINGSITDISIQTAMTIGSWVHLGLVYSKTDSIFYAYINGVKIEGVYANVGTITNSENLTIGYDFSGGDGNAFIFDDFRFYKKALSASEMSAIYNSGYGKKYTGATAEGGVASAAFNFDEGVGNYTLDSVSGLLGTLTGNVINNMWVSGGVPISQTASIEEGIYDILVDDANLNTVISSRIYPAIVPQYAATPCITYQQISGIREQLLSGADGFVSARFQINCWADTYGGARNIANLARRALASKQGEFQGVYIYDIQLEDENDMPQVDAENENISRYGKRLDFIVYFNE